MFLQAKLRDEIPSDLGPPPPILLFHPFALRSLPLLRLDHEARGEEEDIT